MPTQAGKMLSLLDPEDEYEWVCVCASFFYFKSQNTCRIGGKNNYSYKVLDNLRACILNWFNPIWLFSTLWTVACQVLSSLRFSRQEYWRGLPGPPPGDLPDPGIEPGSPALQVDALPCEPLGKIEQWTKQTLPSGISHSNLRGRQTISENW